MPPCHSWGRKRVPTITRFGKSVWPKAEPGFCLDDLVDDLGVVPRIEVVYQLGPLIAEKPRVFEPDRSLHSGHASHQ